MIFNKYYVFLFLIFFTIACSNDFDITEDSKDIPVVYGLLSATDSVQFIRVERAFIDDKISGIELAMDPAQLYFNGISVTVRNERTGFEHLLQRVDGNEFGLIRDKGVFADAPNYLYRFPTITNPLIPGDVYVLIIKKEDGTELTRATTTVLKPYNNLDISTPNINAVLSFSYLNDFRVMWSADNNAAIHDIELVINYTEEKPGIPVSKKSIKWTLARNYNRTTFAIKGRSFYEFLAGALEVDINTRRYFDNASLIIHSGGKEIKDYISVGQANLGITSSGEIPTFSNLSNDGLGIFSSRTQFIRNNIGLALPTLDSLKNGSITKSLNFR